MQAVQMFLPEQLKFPEWFCPLRLTDVLAPKHLPPVMAFPHGVSVKPTKLGKSKQKREEEMIRQGSVIWKNMEFKQASLLSPF